MPPCELVLAPRDDTAEFDDSNDTQSFKDDPKYDFIFSVICLLIFFAILMCFIYLNIYFYPLLVS